MIKSNKELLLLNFQIQCISMYHASYIHMGWGRKLKGKFGSGRLSKAKITTS